MNKEKRILIKKKCREIELMIRNNPLHNDRITDIINEELRRHFGEIVQQSLIDGKTITHYFSVDKWACDIDLYGHNRMIFIRFHKPIKKEPMKDGYEWIINTGSCIKRLSLANFIFKHCNPIGLILLEKIMFQIS